MARPIVVDAGPLIAMVSRKDDHHQAVVAWLETAATRDLLVPSLVLTEVCHYIEKYLGGEAEAAFIEGLMRSPQFAIYHPMDDDFRRMAVLMRQYSDWPLGLADAAVVATAERLKTVEVATVDRRHFEHIKPVHVSHFTLYPESAR
ncbi:type II toxin-antitoxin system VapC family toxin [Amycolatopsis sp. NPDC052450]|uniref:type II toxin-antitoxin system VapC family toxin n=1 Tax=Amycolatopsis sp. NPDC052450 TaxID=3363937 RepID=UPI0037CBB00E